MAAITVVHDYPYPIGTVWRAVTDPELVPRWTATGRGARPVGFAPAVGNRFRFVGRPAVGWSGVVDCEVVDVAEPTLLRFTWRGAEGEQPTLVTYGLEACEGGTRLTYEHTGFRGVGGFVLSRVLGRVRARMLRVGLPPVLAALAGGPPCSGAAAGR